MRRAGPGRGPCRGRLVHRRVRMRAVRARSRGVGSGATREQDEVMKVYSCGRSARLSLRARGLRCARRRVVRVVSFVYESCHLQVSTSRRRAMRALRARVRPSLPLQRRQVLQRRARPSSAAPSRLLLDEHRLQLRHQQSLPTKLANLRLLRQTSGHGKKEAPLAEALAV